MQGIEEAQTRAVLARRAPYEQLRQGLRQGDEQGSLADGTSVYDDLRSWLAIDEEVGRDLDLAEHVRYGWLGRFGEGQGGALGRNMQYR